MPNCSRASWRSGNGFSSLRSPYGDRGLDLCPAAGGFPPRAAMRSVCAHLIRLPVSFFERRQLGDPTSRFGSIAAIQRVVTTAAVEALLDGIMAATTFVMMSAVSRSALRIGRILSLELKTGRLAGVHDEIVRMHMGYQTLIGDLGSCLSGGQKQRLLLARAVYNQPRVLVLDETTRHLDLPRERALVRRLAQWPLTRVARAFRKRKRPTENGQASGIGGQGQNRTADTRIFNPLLYRLSYLAIVSRIRRPGTPECGRGL
jgi:hypothetical protein